MKSEIKFYEKSMSINGYMIFLGSSPKGREGQLIQEANDLWNAAFQAGQKEQSDKVKKVLGI